MESQVLRELRHTLKRGQRKLTRMSGKERRASKKESIIEALRFDGAMEIIDLGTNDDDTMPFSYGI